MKNQDSTTSNDDPWIIDANYTIFVYAVVILTIINSALLLFVDGEAQSVIQFINYCLSLFLVMDALNNLRKQPKRLQYLTRGRGWMVFIGSLPFPFAGVFRLLYFGLGIRMLRHDDWREAHNVIITERAQSTLLMVILSAIIVFESAVLLVLQFEQTDASANIQTANDALWWGIVTVSTVGYGDQVPVTLAGRAASVLLIAIGVGLFTSITSYMADSFGKPRQRRHSRTASLEKHPTDSIKLLEDMRKLLNEEEHKLQQSITALQSRIDELEQRIIDERTHK